jgi:hypothetical protein
VFNKIALSIMNDFPSSMGIREEPVAEVSSIADSDINDLYENEREDQLVTSAPKERFRLGYWEVMALVINRMIGMENSSSVDIFRPFSVHIISYYALRSSLTKQSRGKLNSANMQSVPYSI